MSEEFVNYIWQHKLFNFDNLIESVTSKRIQVIDVGTRNNNSGPDFFNAKIKIKETIWAGNIEVHLKSSDWFKHNHQHDAAYDNIILHVVYLNDTTILRKSGEPIPTLEIKNKFNEAILENYEKFISNPNWIPCANQLINVDQFTQFAWLESLCIERLGIKSQAIEIELIQTRHDFQEIFYRQLYRSFGFNINGHAFELLAKSMPFQVMSKHIDRNDQVEAFLFGQAGMLNQPFSDAYPVALSKEYKFLSEKYNLKAIDPKLWKFLRMRPSNFPTIRMSQLAKLLQATSGILTGLFEIKRLTDIKSFFRIEANKYWLDHSDFDKPSKPKSIRIGIASIEIILINTIIPFTFVYGKLFNKSNIQEKALMWYEEIKAEKNSIIKNFISHGLKIENAKHSQAALHLKKNYCNYKKCLECRFAHTLIHGNT
jgi:hypothetical protein